MILHRVVSTDNAQFVEGELDLREKVRLFADMGLTYRACKVLVNISYEDLTREFCNDNLERGGGDSVECYDLFCREAQQ